MPTCYSHRRRVHSIRTCSSGFRWMRHRTTNERSRAPKSLHRVDQLIAVVQSARGRWAGRRAIPVLVPSRERVWRDTPYCAEMTAKLSRRAWYRCKNWSRDSARHTRAAVGPPTARSAASEKRSGGRAAVKHLSDYVESGIRLPRNRTQQHPFRRKKSVEVIDMGVDPVSERTSRPDRFIELRNPHQRLIDNAVLDEKVATGVVECGHSSSGQRVRGRSARAAKKRGSLIA